MFVKFDDIQVDILEHGVTFSEINGSGQLDYLELLISGHIDYIYFHCINGILGTKILIFKEDYKDWIKDAIQNGANV